MQPRWKVHGRRAWRFVRPIALIILVLFGFRSAVADWNDVPTGSMKPTILEGDRILVNKLAYDLKVPFTTMHLAQWSDPKRGDVVVFDSPEDGIRLVKRVVGVPGDVIEVRGDRVIVNGEVAAYGPLDQKFVDELSQAQRDGHGFLSEQLGTHNHPWMSTPSRTNEHRDFGPTQALPAGQFFMMGDNRDNSKDSRFFGLVDRHLILGRAVAVVASLDITSKLDAAVASVFLEAAVRRGGLHPFYGLRLNTSMRSLSVVLRAVVWRWAAKSL